MLICETCKKKGHRCAPNPDGTCGVYEKRIMTNFERIKAMSVREMSEFFAKEMPGFPSSPCDICEYDDGGVFCLKQSPCTSKGKVANYGRWLESEATE